jgi:hypothetical protein
VLRSQNLNWGGRGGYKRNNSIASSRLYVMYLLGWRYMEHMLFFAASLKV